MPNDYTHWMSHSDRLCCYLVSLNVKGSESVANFFVGYDSTIRIIRHKKPGAGLRDRERDMLDFISSAADHNYNHNMGKRKWNTI